MQPAAIVALALAVLVGMPVNVGLAQDGKVGGAISLNGAGATFPAPLYKKWIESYRAAHPNVSIAYDAVGSGEGIKRYLAETVDFAGSDVIPTDDELAKVRGGVIMVPATAGMIVLAYNIPGATGEIRLPRDVYADIFAGAIRRWDDPRIQAANPSMPGI